MTNYLFASLLSQDSSDSPSGSAIFTVKSLRDSSARDYNMEPEPKDTIVCQGLFNSRTRKTASALFKYELLSHNNEILSHNNEIYDHFFFFYEAQMDFHSKQRWRHEYFH